MGLNNKSLNIILNLYKKGKLKEEEAIQLIDDLYNKPVQYYWYPWTYTNNNTDKIEYTVTC